MNKYEKCFFAFALFVLTSLIFLSSLTNKKGEEKKQVAYYWFKVKDNAYATAGSAVLAADADWRWYSTVPPNVFCAGSIYCCVVGYTSSQVMWNGNKYVLINDSQIPAVNASNRNTP